MRGWLRAESPTFAVNPSRTVEAFHSEIENTFNVYTSALIADDLGTVRAQLSDERLERIEAIGTMSAFVAREKKKLLRELEGASFAGFELVNIDARPNEPVVSASFKFRGTNKEVPKRLYFVLESDGVYRFSGQVPAKAWQEFTVDPSTGIGAMMSSFTTSTYNVRNNSTWLTVQFMCREGIGGSWGSTYDVSASSTRNQSCSNFCGGFFDGGNFNGNDGSGTSFEGALLCDYNSFGDDFIYNGTTWACNDVC